LIKCRNLGATGHVFIVFPEAQDRTLYRLRFGPGQWFAEFVATFGLLLTILGCVARNPAATPYAIGLYITSAYWFTASTSFANPAVAIARSFSDTFAGTDGSVSVHHCPIGEYASGGEYRSMVLAHGMSALGHSRPSWSRPTLVLVRYYSNRGHREPYSITLSASCEHEPQTMHDRG
jgi:hypothetical protein